MAGTATGNLTGVPIGIKDLTPTAGIRTTWGSTLFADHVPTKTPRSSSGSRRRAPSILGKTNTPEYGTGGNTVQRRLRRNPQPLERCTICERLDRRRRFRPRFADGTSG